MDKVIEQEAQRRWLRAVLAQTGWLPTQLARKAGVTPSTINRFLNDEKVTHSLSLPTLKKISEASGIAIPLDLLPRVAEAEYNVDQDRRANIPGRETLTSRIDVYGTAACGEGRGDFELNGEVVDRVRRPPALEGAAGVFGIYVVGDSMEPRYEHGDLVFIHPGRPATVGGDVLVELHGEEGNGGAAYLKKLVRRTADHIVLEQYNPPKQIKISTRQVKHIYRVLRPVELFGV